MFEEINIDKVNSLISFGGKNQGKFKGNEYIPLLQVRGVTALCKILSTRKFAYLADEVGMGKTYQALGVVSTLLSERPGARILIIAPSENVQNNWRKEISRFKANNLMTDASINEKAYQRPKDFIVDCVNRINIDYNVFVLRLTSFSSVAANTVYGGSDDDNCFNRKSLKDSIESVTQRDYPYPLEKYKYDSTEAGQICAEAFNKVTPRFDLVVIDEAQNVRNWNNATAFLNAWLGYRRFETKSSSIATKTLLMSATPAHRNVETLKNQLKYFIAEDKIPERLSHDYLEEFMIRRLRTYKSENKYECRSNVADDVGKGITIEQRLFLALIQKKLADYKINNNANYKIGFLETFESFDPTEDDLGDEDGKDLKKIKEFENGNSHEKDEYGHAVDKKIMRDVAKSYRNVFNDEDFPPHPKLNYMENIMVTTYKSGEPDEDNCPDKSIVFVRRIASVQELQKRLIKKYEDQVVKYWSRKFNIKDGKLRDIQARFEQDYNKTVGFKQPVDDLADDAETDDESYDADTLETKSQLIKWLAQKKSDRGTTFSAVSRFKKSLQRNRSNFEFFEENYLRTLFEAQRKAGITTRSFTQFVNHLVDDRMVNEVARYIAARPELYYRKAPDNKGNKYSRSNLLVLCCYVAIRIINTNLASQIFEYYKINEPTLDSIPNPIVKKKMIRDILKGTSVWNKIIENNDVLIDEALSYDLFVKREMMKKCIQKYLLLSDAVLEILYSYCSIDRNSSSSDAISLFFRNNWNRKTEISVRIRQFINNYELVHSQLFSDITDKLDITYDPRFLNDQRWVVGAMGGTDNSAIISRFNTPFFPDIIVCTDVMKEGINLHLFCNKVFHYGLAWTPGDLEQRVGRVDRYFSKTFRARSDNKDMKVEITYPYMGKTIDEHQLKKVLGFKIAVDPLLDYTTTKNIDVDSLESTSVEELASFVPDESCMTNTPYSGKRYWDG
ncbi:SNF2-related protein [Butyrivibrio sp. AE2032]|uniref:SNF2-related protein n=1 Tax=Butyrivibrio sp. AE2032 TaxID=1458463 RepID=UPI0005530FD4|nr:SNF2-related protein [Butyrivibrio sp. AE2032]